MGLVEGQLHVVPPEPLSPLQEVPDSPTAAAAALLEEEQQQRGGMFSRLLSQLFDQSTWQQDPTWHHGTAEFDVVGSATEPVSVASPHGTVRAHSIQTAAIAAHPSKQLYLTGCSSGLLHLWQFGEQHALATYTPVPGSELEKINQTFSGLLSFSRSFKYSTAAPRLANWGKAAAVRFAPSGERFAAVGEGGVVATWRLDAPTRLADADGHGCAEWWHQALSKQGCAVDFVGGSSSVLVVGGRCMHSSGGSSGSTSNLSVWDTMAPPASNCVGRLSSHQATVTSVAMLPGGWLLSAGDAEGGLSCTDLRMIGGSSGPRLLWSVKAARGALRALVPIPGAGSSGGALRYGSGGSSAVLATAGMDGAVRLWRGSDGKLLQSLEMAHYSSRPGSAGSRRSSHDGAPLSPRLAPGSHAVPVTGLAVCEEGLVSCGSDGCVRLYNFL
jgi:WD40 repeat protein